MERNIQEGFVLLDSCPDLPALLATHCPDSVSLLLCLAQWIDLGYGTPRLMDECYAGFAHSDVANLPFIDALKLKLAQAFYSLATEDAEQCAALLDIVLRAGDGILAPHLLFLCHFWKGRAHRKNGEYEAALLHITVARKTAERANAPRLVASTKIHESWLFFQRGERRRASQLLDEAEEGLRLTGHTLSLGNIESARGRFIRRSGDYVGALSHFERAIAIYSNGFSDHPNCARALVNAAYVKRLIAHDLRTKIGDKPAKGPTHERYLRIFSEALDLLARAGEIYFLHRQQTGFGSVLVNSGHLHLESGNIDRAATEAQKAFQLGQEKHDAILMARTRILQSAIELALAEEDLDEDVKAHFHATQAVDFAEEAIALGTHTQNKRLLAEAYLIRGAAASDEHFQDWEVARTYADKAAELVSKDDRDHLLKDLHTLKTKVFRATGIDHTLRQWSNGQVGNKTFQQIQEEFAEIVIPQVWLRQGKNVSRVAQQLSISPKKVRRILQSTHLRDH